MKLETVKYYPTRKVKKDALKETLQFIGGMLVVSLIVIWILLSYNVHFARL